ncbi:MAG: hypothetical protein WBQ78_02630 [Gammaproteobacteria bacterium]
MYFDNLTITALVIFIFEFGLVVRFCVFGSCGGPLRDEEPGVTDKPC